MDNSHFTETVLYWRVCSIWKRDSRRTLTAATATVRCLWWRRQWQAWRSIRSTVRPLTGKLHLPPSRPSLMYLQKSDSVFGLQHLKSHNRIVDWGALILELSFTTRSRIKEAHGGIENALKKIHVQIQRCLKAMRDPDNECKYCEHQTDEVNNRQNV